MADAPARGCGGVGRRAVVRHGVARPLRLLPVPIRPGRRDAPERPVGRDRAIHLDDSGARRARARRAEDRRHARPDARPSRPLPRRRRRRVGRLLGGRGGGAAAEGGRDRGQPEERVRRLRRAGPRPARRLHAVQPARARATRRRVTQARACRLRGRRQRRKRRRPARARRSCLAGGEARVPGRPPARVRERGPSRRPVPPGTSRPWASAGDWPPSTARLRWW